MMVHDEVGVVFGGAIAVVEWAGKMTMEMDQGYWKEESR